MKRILSLVLMFFAITGISLLAFKLYPKPVAEVLEINSSDSPAFTLNFTSGMEFNFDGEISSSIDLSFNNEREQESFTISTNITLKSYQDSPEGLLWGISLQNPLLFVNGQASPLLDGVLGEVFFLSREGDITEFLIAEGMDTLYVNTLKSLALALQLKSPDRSNSIASGKSWLHREAGQNGYFDIQYTADRQQDIFQIQKKYLKLRNSDGLRVGENSASSFKFHADSSQLLALDLKMTLVNDSSAVKLTGTHTINLRATGHRRGLGEKDLLSQLRRGLATEKPDQLPKLSRQEKLQNYQNLVKGISPEQMLSSVAEIGSLRDENIPDLLLQLEAMVALDRSFAVSLIEHLNKNHDVDNFAEQLSLIMGAIASMDAKDIEAELLEFSYQHQGDENITQQTAFALAELNGASEAVYYFLEELSQSPAQELRTIGLLSLGTLGQQAEHALNISFALQDGLSQGKEADKNIFLAALANTKNPSHIDTFATYLQSGNESYMEQALFGLKQIPGEKSFSLISQLLLAERRESLLLVGIQAMAGHLEQEGSVEILVQTFHNSDSIRVKMDALSVIAAAAAMESKAKDFLFAVKNSINYDRRLATYAGELLLSI